MCFFVPSHDTQQMLDAETCMPQNDVWQSELKDLLWLELRAYLADRTPSEQDQFFCREREGIGDLLKSIMEFRLDEKSVVTDAENGEGQNFRHVLLFCIILLSCILLFFQYIFIIQRGKSGNSNIWSQDKAGKVQE